MRGKPWTAEEENRLRELVNAKKSVRVIAKALGKTRECVRMKIARLAFEEEVVIRRNARTTTTNLPLELPSVEEVLKKLVSALIQLEQPDLDPNETLRLRSIVQSVKIYKELLSDFINYREIEARLFEMEAKYARLVENKTKVPTLESAAAKVAQSSGKRDAD